MRDRCGRLADYWYPAALSTELGRKRPLGRQILGVRLVLFRGANGAPVCLPDRCLHRNAPLSAGAIFDGKLGCPYHGWTYDATGRCVQIPSQGDCPVDGALSLRPFPVREQHGLVWVFMGRGAPTVEPFAMPYWDAPGWGRYYMVTSFANDVTHLVENFMDVPHTVFVHRGWFRSTARKRVRTLVERTRDSVLVTYDQPHDSIGFTGRLINPGGLPMVHTDRFYMPSVTRVDYTFGDRTGFVITSVCAPRAPFDTLVYTLIGYKVGLPLLSRVAGWLLPWYTRKVIGQDVDIMALQGENLRHHGELRFHGSPADLLHEHIESLRDFAAGGAGPPPEPRSDTLDFWI